MKKFEYKTWCNTQDDIKDEVLKRFGEEGWEVCGYSERRDAFNEYYIRYVYKFKREIEQSVEWEHKSVAYDFRDNLTFDDFFEEHAKGGWEMCGTDSDYTPNHFPHSNMNCSLTFFFKRRK